MNAMRVPRHEARARALAFSWTESATQFLRHLVPTRKDMQGKTLAANVTVTRLS